MSTCDAILQRLYQSGELTCRTHIVNGLENAPEALKLLFSGQNEGKRLVNVSAPH